MKQKLIIWLIVICMSLTACSGVVFGPPDLSGEPEQPPQPTQKSEGKFKVGNPYKIFGVKYRPRETYNHVETGIASWYGPKFHGKPTANGETFDMYELTAAHRTLQMPSLVRVTNLENGRSLIVRVNDRGPFKRGRIIDLSKRGAELLGFKNQGTAKVRVEVLSEESRAIAQAARRGVDTRGIEVAMNENGRLPEAFDPAGQAAAPEIARDPQADVAQASLTEADRVELAPPSVKGHYKDGKFLPDPVVTTEAVEPTSIFVQAGSFSDRGNAENLASRLKTFGQTQVVPATVRGQMFYRVRVGPAKNVPAADALLQRMARNGWPEAIIIVD